MKKHKNAPFKFAVFALIPLCMLMAVIIMNVVQAAGVSGNGKGMDDTVILKVSGDNVRVTVGVDNAFKENVTAVSLALNVDIEKGDNAAVFNFADGLSDTVNGSRYESGKLYLFVAGQNVIFDEDDMLVLGELSLGDGFSADNLTATVSYMDGSLQVANSAFGSRMLHDVKTDAAKINRENTTTEPETTTEAPQPETTTEAPQPETTTEAPQPESTTEATQPETMTEAPQPETTTEASQPETTTGASQPAKPDNSAGKNNNAGTESSTEDTSSDETEAELEQTTDETLEETTESITEITTEITTAQTENESTEAQQTTSDSKTSGRIAILLISIVVVGVIVAVYYMLYRVYKKK